MAIDVEARIRLEQRLADVLGDQEAVTLMSMLPRSDPDELATKADVRGLEERMSIRFEGMQEQFDGLRGQFDGLREQFDGLRQQFAALDARVTEGFSALESRLGKQLSDDLREGMVKANRTVVIGDATTLVGAITVSLAILRLTG